MCGLGLGGLSDDGVPGAVWPWGCGQADGANGQNMDYST